MSDLSAQLDKEIAALEQALSLPLPDASRSHLEQQLQQLRARRAANAGGIYGTTTVTGTMHGNAIGVNLGTVNYNASSANPTAAPGTPNTSVTDEDIADQRELLESHRRTLHIHLKQRAQLTSAYEPPVVEHGIREARAAIKKIKETLRGWGVPVEDHPNDVEK
jgi:hypothetical protein